MEVILKEDVQNLGYKYDIVNVKPGYARNYLIPKGLAIEASPSAIKACNEIIRQRAKKEEKLIEEARKTAEKLSKTTIEIKVKAGETGKIFGSVNAVMISDALKDKGIEVDRKNIQLPASGVKETGKYTAVAILYKGIKAEFEFDVVAE